MTEQPARLSSPHVGLLSPIADTWCACRGDCDRKLLPGSNLTEYTFAAPKLPLYEA
ncbi:hypothetical protein BH11GEM2_BH11GEM2_00160 [soil metagenome]